MINTIENVEKIKMNGIEYKFKDVSNLNGCETFREFEGKFDGDILYADGQGETVIDALLEPIDYNSDMNWFNLFKSIDLYFFDGWFIAIKYSDIIR